MCCVKSVTTAAGSAIDAGIQKEIHGSGTTTLIISNEELNDIMNIVQANILVFYRKELVKQLKMKQSNKKEDF